MTEAEGGRGTRPCFENDRPQFYFGTTDVVGAIELGDLTMVVPGDFASLGIELGRPVAFEIGTGFAVRKGGRTVAAGRVTALLA